MDRHRLFSLATLRRTVSSRIRLRGCEPGVFAGCAARLRRRTCLLARDVALRVAYPVLAIRHGRYVLAGRFDPFLEAECERAIDHRLDDQLRPLALVILGEAQAQPDQ